MRKLRKRDKKDNHRQEDFLPRENLEYPDTQDTQAKKKKKKTFPQPGVYDHLLLLCGDFRVADWLSGVL